MEWENSAEQHIQVCHTWPQYDRSITGTWPLSTGITIIIIDTNMWLGRRTGAPGPLCPWRHVNLLSQGRVISFGSSSSNNNMRLLSSARKCHPSFYSIYTWDLPTHKRDPNRFTDTVTFQMVCRRFQLPIRITREVDFDITRLDGQVKILQKYQLSFATSHQFSSRQANLGVTRLDGQVEVNS